MDLLDRVLLRFAQVNDSTSLSQFVETFLVAVIESTHRENPIEVRQKAVTVLSGIKSRLLAHPEVSLPTAGLIEGLLLPPRGCEDFPVALVFARIALAREKDRHAARRWAERLLGGGAAASRPPAAVASVLAIAAETIFTPWGEEPSDNHLLHASFYDVLQPADAAALGEFAVEVLLLAQVPSTLAEVQGDPARLALLSGLGDLAALQRRLPLIKLGLVRALSGPVCDPDVAIAPLLVASADGSQAVASLAEAALRRLGQDVHESERAVSKCFSLFPHAPPSLRARIVAFLSKSLRAASSEQAVSMAFLCIFPGPDGPPAPPRLRLSGMAFVRWLITHMEPSAVPRAGPALLGGLLRVMREGSSADQAMRGFLFSALGDLSRRYPAPFISPGAELVGALLAALRDEQDRDVRLCILEALGGARAAWAKNPEALAASPQLERMLLASVEGPSDVMRLAALQWMGELYPPSHVPTRYACLVGIAHAAGRPDMLAEAQSGLADAPARAVDPASLLRYVLEERNALLPAITAPLLSFAVKVMDAQPEAAIPPGLLDGLHGLAEGVLHSAGVAGMSGASAHGVHTAIDTLLYLVSLRPVLYAESLNPSLLVAGILSAGVPVSTKETLARLLAWAEHGKASASPSASVKKLAEVVAAELAAPSLASASTDSVCAALHALAYLGHHESEPLLLGLVSRGVDNASSALVSASAAEALAALAQTTPASAVDASAKSTAALVSLSERLRKVDADPKVLERVISALGLICQAAAGAPALRAQTCSDFLAMVGVKGDELQFAVGESLAYCGGAPLSREAALNYSTASPALRLVTQSQKSSSSSSSFTVSQVFDKVLLMMASKDLSAIGRCSVAIWLLSLAKFGDEPVKARLGDLQQVFLNLLMDSNETTQEVASKGLGLVYDLGDERLRDGLVSSLVDTLSGKEKRQPKVVDGEGALQVELAVNLPSSKGAQERIGTYRELCAAATEMGQPDLIYRFLDVAQHQTVWLSKRGAAFGFSNIMAKAGGAAGPGKLAGQLHDLLPKLFRYQYDPNQAIQSAMSQIWRDLVPEPKRAITENLSRIIEELVASTTSRLWRVREAACCALADVLPERDFGELQPWLERLWGCALRALDDIKDSVREAAVRACEALAKVTARTARQSAPLVVPLLIREGLESKVDDRVRLGLRYLVMVCREAGAGLAPVVAEAAAGLLENMSSLEDAKLNYLVFHAGDHLEELERARLAASSGSPVAEALDMCIRQLTPGQLPALLAKMTALVRQGLGLPTKGAVARLATRLAFGRNAADPESLLFADLLKAMFAALLDRSAVIRVAYADALASLARICPRKDVDKVVERCLALYRPWDTKENRDEARQAAADFFLRLGRVAGDTFAVYRSEILPIAAIGSRDGVEATAKAWSAIWDENLAGGGAALYKRDILEITLNSCLGSASYLARTQGCRALTETLLKDLDPEEAATALSAVAAMIPGSSWPGKESVISCVAALLGKIGHPADRCEAIASQVLNLILSQQVQASNKRFLAGAAKALAAILEGAAKTLTPQNVLPDDRVPFAWVALGPIAFPPQKVSSSAPGGGKDADAAEDDDNAEESRAARRAVDNDLRCGLVRALAVLLPEGPRAIPEVRQAVSLGARGGPPEVRTACLSASSLCDLDAALHCLDDNKFRSVRTAAIALIELKQDRLTPEQRRVLEARALSETDLALRDRMRAILMK